MDNTFMFTWLKQNITKKNLKKKRNEFFKSHLLLGIILHVFISRPQRFFTYFHVVCRWSSALISNICGTMLLLKFITRVFLVVDQSSLFCVMVKPLFPMTINIQQKPKTTNVQTQRRYWIPNPKLSCHGSEHKLQCI